MLNSRASNRCQVPPGRPQLEAEIYLLASRGGEPIIEATGGGQGRPAHR
jgi:hypothetical protein